MTDIITSDTGRPGVRIESVAPHGMMISATAAVVGYVMLSTQPGVTVNESMVRNAVAFEAPDAIEALSLATIDDASLAEYAAAHGENLDDMLESAGRLFDGSWPLTQRPTSAQGRKAIVRAELASDPE